MDFPDFPHLQHLRNDLWQWPKSRAAVMVGAGLSLNAEALPGASKGFPTWSQLVRAMLDALNPPPRGETREQARRREARFCNASPLRVASEYEAAFGPRKLEILIREQNSDAVHQPGILHQLLLKLPWADVFTTNYDTLLERTEVPGRSYHAVTKAGELTTAFAPRIVKLHGSFPSQTPFIITEEHYRTYPRNFAPFVNCVRQSLLENSFALIGFSGDDPNFLEWTGWIRDELGCNHAPVYFVGPLSLTSAQRSLLQHRGVTPIDLAPVFEDKRPNDVHAASIEWFLRSLWDGRKPRPEDWPDVRHTRQTVVSSLPPLPDPVHSVPESVERGPLGPLDAEDVRKVLDRWGFEREHYPDWTVAPQHLRAKLWERTKLWTSALVQFARGWAAADRIFLFREINWRIETAMAPFSPDLTEAFENALNELFDDVAQGRSVSPSSDSAGPSRAASDVADAWCQIALALIRDAREAYDTDRWKRLKDKIDKVSPRHPKYSDRNHYEAALWAMWNMDRQQAKNVLARWQPPSRSPLAQIRKAALLAELDEIGEATTLLRSALQEIRRALRSQGQNVELLSLEGWCSYSLSNVELALDSPHHADEREELRHRWQELKAYDCDPWTYIKYFEAVLSAAPPRPPSPEEEVLSFDPGEVIVSRNFGGDPIGPILPAFAYIRLYEQAGLPMRLRMVDTRGETLKKACCWLAPFARFWSPALLIRAGRIDEDSLRRTRLAVMDLNLAKRIYAWCLQIAERELAYITGPIGMGSSLESILKVLSEVLSRLTINVDAAELAGAFRVAIHLYEKPGVRLHPNLAGACDQWFKRLFEAADCELLLDWLPSLIRLPLFGDIQLGEHADRDWPDPMRTFPSWRCRQANGISTDVIAKVNEATDWLLRRATSETGEGRHRAVERLIGVFRAKLMKIDQERQLGELLWGQKDSTGLPDRPGFAVSALLHFPAPANIDVKSLVKSHILSLPSTGALNRGAPLIYEASLSAKPIVQIAGEPEGTIEWTSEEARRLYQGARDWWANDRVALQPPGKRFVLTTANPVESTGRRLGEFLARVVLSRVDWFGEAEWQELFRWLQELRGASIFPTLALPYILLRRPAEAGAVAETIAADVASDIEDAVSAAAKATRHWKILSAAGLTPPPPPSLTISLVERIVFRRKPGIRSCISHLAYLITERQDAITPSQAEWLTASLEPWNAATVLPVPTTAPGEFDEAERPDMRAWIASLAASLRAWYGKHSPEAPEPPAITRWRDRCRSDRLPEVRRAFDDWENVGAL
jgi:hypothetical protein